MTGYNIANWDKFFENNKTRILKRMAWVPFPNKHDGDGYTELVSDHKNGPAHYGAWCVIVQVASKCDPRGVLVRDQGYPHDAKSISRKTRLPAALIAEALPRLVSIGWLETWEFEGNDVPGDGTIVADEQKSTEQNGTEEKNVLSEKRAKALTNILEAYRKIKRKDDTRSRAKKHISALLIKYSSARLLRAVENYALEAAGTEEQFCRGIGNFFGRDADWKGYADKEWKVDNSQSEQEQVDQEAYDKIGKSE